MLSESLSTTYPQFGETLIKLIQSTESQQIQDVQNVFRSFVFFQAVARQDFSYLRSFFAQVRPKYLEGYYWLTLYFESVCCANCQVDSPELYLSHARDLFNQYQDAQAIKAISVIPQRKSPCEERDQFSEFGFNIGVQSQSKI
ncbi:hypothetical protein ACQ4M3_09470 [Leptolyngbya sp. AN03gr2]|uniref:hypothetical protein n=1 Tax=Leptolyngbya sp. AN03gr2 TaxID=3423364 RepID=UPI003D314E3C